MHPRRLWLAAAVVSAATLAAQSAAPVPPEYQDLHDELVADVAAFQQTIDQSWDGSRWPVAFSANLSSADSSAGPVLLGPNALTAVRLELDSLKALGAKAVTLDLDFPVLYPPFHQSQADYQQYLGFYTQVAQEVRARGLKLVVETQAIFSQPGYANWNVGPFYAGLTLDQYEQGRAAVAETIAQNLRPDYLSVIQEPDTEAAQTGKPELATSAGSAALLDAILQALGAAPVPGVSVGAGFGTWQADYQTWASTFLARPIDFLDMHVYPANRDFLPRAIELADMAAAAGRQVGMSETWLYKERQSELDTLPLSTILGRDTFSFWAPLDAQYLRAMVDFAHFKHLAFLSPFWSEYFHAYVDYNAVTANLPPDALNELARSLQASASLAGTYTGSGLGYMGAIVDPPDVTPPGPPAGLAAALTSLTSGVLYWTPARDDVGVATYRVSRNGVALGQTALPNFSDSGLSDATTYHYSVVAVDASGHASPPAAVDLTTPPFPDMTPPVVNVTYPAPGARVGRTAVLVAVAYDLRGGLYDAPSGVANLQFRVDGADVGPVQTTPAYGTDRYSVYWMAVSTAGYGPGTHTVTAAARDRAGNLGVSPPVTITFSGQ